MTQPHATSLRATGPPSAARASNCCALWVPDPAAPGFAAEAARQAVLINTAPDVRDIERFIEAATADLTLDPYDWGSDGPPAFLHDTSKDRSGSSS